ncbi:Two-component response regulator ARR22 [Carex littledalei]|uniref:Two-component response regulator ARR22 n=1 Tax=Carex littledalei TaxID=544730 RepID=A0A833RKJ1_9POAL|nr:Two-component response regulator ARR22 [Carex littledalei]
MATAQVVKVLIVDDDSVIRGVHKMLLARFAGFQITEAENGKVAVDHFSDGNEFDLVLMDKEMPEMDGVKATRALKSMGATGKIVAITADESSMEAFMDAGADKFMTKPIGRSELGDILKTFNLLN